MSLTRTCLALSLALVALAAIVPANGADYYYSARQYYGTWNKHPTHSYHYRKYYYKPSYDYYGYRHNYVVYYTSRPKYCYYYNPYKKSYWGRCYSSYGADYDGHGVYSMLSEEHRGPRVNDIKEEHFPKPSEPPFIPESKDQVRLDLPPDDLPEDVKPTITAPVGE